MDFTLTTYRQLLLAFQSSGYSFITMEQYCRGERPARHVILRHDVDKRPANSLATAQIEHSLGIHASYYFRIVPESWNTDIILSIRDLGHEIGYHYEDMSLAHGDTSKAIDLFEQHLAQLRQYYPVSTICMHGAPTSLYDGRDLWKTYDYHNFGIIGEPYFDVDFDHTLYLTDTGRRWDGFRVSVRDKVPQQQQWIQQGLTFHHTLDIIHALYTTTHYTTTHYPLHHYTTTPLPSTLMLTTHPQRWTSSPLAWVQELLIQSIKNIIKRIIVCLKGY